MLQKKLDATVADMRFIKPLDKELILSLAKQHDILVTLEENAIMGGAGSGVNELLMQERCLVPVLNLGLPDLFVPQGGQEEIRADLGLDATGIEKSIKAYSGSFFELIFQKSLLLVKPERLLIRLINSDFIFL
ncbi:1-deoxy-D-xylulose-5-phosphate synthase [Proteus mirabilis]|uniref:1-deoxy-D-xylulose-5-phosphate synthase n=1 Tax=Proteus mirabilis TaxID=584 RepID=A0A379FJ76_PROMI|nr:1-deoxy-D-xylulose-5-phosphate synthase [Proteus mirabilis]